MTSNLEITIRALQPTEEDLIREIANWYHTEWATPKEKTIQLLSNQPNADFLVQLVLEKNGKAVATTGLCYTVNILKVHEHLTQYGPWVALFYTRPEFRNQGLGKLLLDELDQHTKTFNLSKIYLSTYSAKTLYTRCNWKTLDTVRYKEHDTVVMEKNLI